MLPLHFWDAFLPSKRVPWLLSSGFGHGLADSGSWLANSLTLPKGLLRAILVQTTFSSHQLVQYFNLNNNNNTNYFILFYMLYFIFFSVGHSCQILPNLVTKNWPDLDRFLVSRAGFSAALTVSWKLSPFFWNDPHWWYITKMKTKCTRYVQEPP